MKITREEFKEFVDITTQVQAGFQKYSEYFNEDILNELLWPYFNWVEKSLGFIPDEELFGLIWDYGEGEDVVTSYKYENGNFYDIKHSRDLDELYETLIVKEKHCQED